MYTENLDKLLDYAKYRREIYFSELDYALQVNGLDPKKDKEIEVRSLFTRGDFELLDDMKALYFSPAWKGLTGNQYWFLCVTCYLEPSSILFFKRKVNLSFLMPIVRREVNDMEWAVFSYKFALEGTERHTTEETAEHFDMTEERIRQIEAKVFKKLKHPAVIDRIWPSLSEKELPGKDNLFIKEWNAYFKINLIYPSIELINKNPELAHNKMKEWGKLMSLKQQLFFCAMNRLKNNEDDDYFVLGDEQLSGEIHKDYNYHAILEAIREHEIDNESHLS